jgi:hypothetical protein
MLFIKQLQNFASISLDAIVKRKQIDIFTEKLCFFIIACICDGTSISVDAMVIH